MLHLRQHAEDVQHRSQIAREQLERSGRMGLVAADHGDGPAGRRMRCRMRQSDRSVSSDHHVMVESCHTF
ncbi:hypothetical protein [Occultella gossypii]|uniref:Uncharacterized protein n=1 Tax=Occultella gossypii TaxID=2800820 RepID=A0ABS7S9G2_9MICO|nr:hypothetical protein [Occultella gossypii]MBZ2196971.1 hypothetical protein [Occultella gossypii]